MEETSEKEQLRQFVGQIEHLEKEKSSIMENIKDIYQHAKTTGFDVKALRQIIRIRKMDRRELDELVELYKKALGMDE